MYGVCGSTGTKSLNSWNKQGTQTTDGRSWNKATSTEHNWLACSNGPGNEANKWNEDKIYYKDADTVDAE